MPNDRRVDAYKLATSLDQTTLDETFRGGESDIHTIGILTKTVGINTYTLRFSDRSKYVGDDFYQGRAKFPEIKRTVGELISPSIQFSEMEVQLNNVDGFYNNYLSSGADYFSFIGARLLIKVGLRETESTYFTMFDGLVPDEDGFSIDRQIITIRARDKADGLNKATGLPYINSNDYPTAPKESYGKIIPMVVGDWTIGYNIIANAGTISITYAGNNYDIITDAPGNFYGGIIGYPVGGEFFVFSIGNYTPDTILNCHIKRGNNLIQCNFDPTPQDAAGYWVVEILSLKVSSGGTIPYEFQDGDVATIQVGIPYDTVPTKQYSNPIRLAKEILKTLGDKVDDDFDASSWNAMETKSTPPQSALASIKARIWIGEDNDKILEEALQLLEQVRVELYFDSALKIALRSIHPEDFYSHGDFRLEQIYVDEESLKVTSDTRNFFNSALGNYAYTPIIGKTQLQTKTRKNQNSIDKSGKVVSKAIDLPALYIESDVLNQVDEFIKFYSCGQEYVEAKVAWTAMLLDLTEIVKVFYNIGSVTYDNTPMKIRDITFTPDNGCFNFKFLSFANFPYSGYTPVNASRMLSSQTETITDA